MMRWLFLLLLLLLLAGCGSCLDVPCVPFV